MYAMPLPEPARYAPRPAPSYAPPLSPTDDVIYFVPTPVPPPSQSRGPLTFVPHPVVSSAVVPPSQSLGPLRYSAYPGASSAGIPPSVPGARPTSAAGVTPRPYAGPLPSTRPVSVAGALPGSYTAGPPPGSSRPISASPGPAAAAGLGVAGGVPPGPYMGPPLGVRPISVVPTVRHDAARLQRSVPLTETPDAHHRSLSSRSFVGPVDLSLAVEPPRSARSGVSDRSGTSFSGKVTPGSYSLSGPPHETLPLPPSRAAHSSRSGLSHSTHESLPLPPSRAAHSSRSGLTNSTRLTPLGPPGGAGSGGLVLMVPPPPQLPPLPPQLPPLPPQQQMQMVQQQMRPHSARSDGGASSSLPPPSFTGYAKDAGAVRHPHPAVPALLWAGGQPLQQQLGGGGGGTVGGRSGGTLGGRSGGAFSATLDGRSGGTLGGRSGGTLGGHSGGGATTPRSALTPRSAAGGAPYDDDADDGASVRTGATTPRITPRVDPTPFVRHVAPPDVDAALRDLGVAAANPHGLSISIGHAVITVGGPERLALPFVPRGWWDAGAGLPAALRAAVPEELAVRGVPLEGWRSAVGRLQDKVQSLQRGFWPQLLLSAAASLGLAPCYPWCCVGARYHGALAAWLEELNLELLAPYGLHARLQTATWDSVECWFGRLGWQHEERSWLSIALSRPDARRLNAEPQFLRTCCCGPVAPDACGPPCCGSCGGVARAV